MVFWRTMVGISDPGRGTMVVGEHLHWVTAEIIRSLSDCPGSVSTSRVTLRPLLQKSNLITYWTVLGNRQYWRRPDIQ